VDPLVEPLVLRQRRLHRVDVEADEPKPSHPVGQHARQAAVTAPEIEPEPRGEIRARERGNLGRAPHRRRRLKRIDLEKRAKQSSVHESIARR
jgi:hypothetical protein